MAVNHTRLLLLGAVATFEPVNGYQIRRELLSWQVDAWAHINPGSIYHGLAALTRDGLLRRHEVSDGGREVAVYELTDEGRTQLTQMQIEALETVDVHDRVGFHLAFGMIPGLSRKQVLASLVKRRVGLEEEMTRLVGEHVDGGYAPPHARRGLALWMDLASAELAWLREVIEDVRSGALKFEVGEDWGWQPPADDPGRQMVADREKYRALLGR